MNKDIFMKTEYRETRKSMSFLKANLVAVLYPVPLVILYVAIFVLATENRWPGQGDSVSFTVSAFEPFLWLLLYIVSFFGCIVLHEFFHALFFLRGCDYGWKSIVFGVKSATPYCHCKEVMPVSVYRQSLLAPLWAVCIPLVAASMITGNVFLMLLTVSMIFGSGGDLAIYWMIRKYPGKTAYVWDMEDAVGCIIYEQLPDAPQSES
jgi:hypothetical protein